MNKKFPAREDRRGYRITNKKEEQKIFKDLVNVKYHKVNKEP